MNVARALLLVLAAVALASCASGRSGPLTLSEEDRANILAEELAWLDAASQPPAPKPAAPRSVGFPEAPKRPDPLDRRITLTAGGAPLNLLLSRLADQAGLRLVTEREVTAETPVSATFQRLTIREALGAVLTPLGLSSRVDGDALVVYAFDTRSWTISLPVLSLSEATSLTNSVNLGPRAEVATKVPDVSTWTELEAAVKAIASRDGTVVVSPALGLVTVRDRPDRLREIDRFLARSEAEAAQQVAVEIHAFEVALGGSDGYGIDWSRVWDSLAGNTSVSVAPAVTTPLTLPVGVSLSEPGGVRQFIRALSSQGKVKVLSQPSIRLLNGHPAIVQAGRVRAFVTEVSQTGTGATGASMSALKLGSVQDGVILPLTARVVRDEVILNVAPILSQVRDIRKVASGTASIEAPDVDSRSLQTTVRLRSGETVVLGGLFSSPERDERLGFPIALKHVPIVGWLFGARKKSAVRTELVLTLTPTIVAPAVARRPS